MVRVLYPRATRTRLGSGRADNAHQHSPPTAANASGSTAKVLVRVGPSTGAAYVEAGGSKVATGGMPAAARTAPASLAAWMASIAAMRCGTAHVDITPGLDLDLLGYDFRQEKLPPGHAGVLDPLGCRALALTDGPTAALLVSLDLCIVSVPFARQLRQAAAKAAGCPVEAVVLACSHTHSGPDPREPVLRDDLAQVLPHASAADQASTAYRERLVAAVAEAAARAAGLTVPVTASATSAACALGYGRRVRTADGVRLCWNPQEQAHLAPQPTADPALSLLWLQPAGRARPVAVWNAGAHPVCLGKTSRVVSADWPGAANQRIADGGVDPLFVLGACGDTHPWSATQADPVAMERIGALAAGMVDALSGALVPDHRQSLATAATTIRLGGHDLDLAAWRIGPAVLLAAPVELFAQLGAELRRRIDGPVLLATNANGWTGYWPTSAAFAEGGYEVDAARAMGRTAGDGEALVEALVGLVPGG
jgi:hypothetical protein